MIVFHHPATFRNGIDTGIYFVTIFSFLKRFIVVISLISFFFLGCKIDNCFRRYIAMVEMCQVAGNRDQLVTLLLPLAEQLLNVLLVHFQDGYDNLSLL